MTVVINKDGTVTFASPGGKSTTVSLAEANRMGILPKDAAGNPVTTPGSYSPGGAGDTQNLNTHPIPEGATPGPTPGSWIDDTGAVHYPAADTTGYGQIGAAFDQRPQDILKAMDDATAREQALIAKSTAEGQANLAAAAGATRQSGQDILNNAYATSANQAAQGQAGLQQAAGLADYNNQLGAQAMQGFSALGTQAQNASAAYGAQGDQLLQQQQAIQGTGIDQLMAMQQQTGRSLADYANYANRGAGPSAAEAQLALARDQAQADAISLANSGRGPGQAAANLRQAQAINAATQQQSAMQMAQLRAQEEAAWRQQQLQAIAGAGSLGLQGGQAAQSAWQNYLQQAGQAASGAAGLGAQYAGMAKDLYGAGVNAQQGYGAQANQALNTGLNYNQGMNSNANAATSTGVSGYNSLAGQANQMTEQGANLGFQGAQQNAAFEQGNIANKNNIYTTQLNSDTQRYGANAGVAINSANNSAQQQAAIVGTIGTIAGAAALASDRRMKEKIEIEPELATRMLVINKFLKGRK